jgi:hypothetical protein
LAIEKLAFGVGISPEFVGKYKKQKRLSENEQPFFNSLFY